MTASTPLALLFALIALFSAVELVWQRHAAALVSYVADREAQATHLVMNGAMAAMFAPFFTATWAAALRVGCVAAMLVLGIRLVWPGRERPPGRAAGTVFHLVGLAAMVWSLGAMAAMAPAAMAGMTMAHRSWLAISLAALFLLEGLATAVLAALAPATMVRMANVAAGTIGHQPLPGGAPIRAVRLAAVPHVVMDAGMVLMLVPLA